MSTETDFEAVRAEAGLKPRRVYKINKCSDEELNRRAERIRPLVSYSDGLWFIKPQHLTDVAYLWKPTKDIKAPEMQVIGQFRCLHTYGHPSLFKPSIAEVLWQIPEEMLDRAKAFELTTAPRNSDDLNAASDALNQGFHVSTINVYA